MKKNQNEKTAEKDILDEMLEGTSLADAEMLDVVIGENVCVILDGKMTVLELTKVVDTLSMLASDLTVILAKACGFCDNCGDSHPCKNSDNKNDCGTISCHNTPESWVAQCELCQSLLDGSGDVRVPDYVLEEAGIPTDAKLEAYADEDSGEITVVEADIQEDITDVPPGIVAILASSGICLAKLDELIMLEEIVYGQGEIFNS
jgi:hypothetical protein